jgi:hypothetical protein
MAKTLNCPMILCISWINKANKHIWLQLKVTMFYECMLGIGTIELEKTHTKRARLILNDMPIQGTL